MKANSSNERLSAEQELTQKLVPNCAVTGEAERASSLGPRTCAAEEFLHQYQHDMLSLVEQMRELRHPAGADIPPRRASGSRGDLPRPGPVILHLVPVPGSWPSTPERRLARLLKYALRAAGYRATKIEPAAPRTPPGVPHSALRTPYSALP